MSAVAAFANVTNSTGTGKRYPHHTHAVILNEVKDLAAAYYQSPTLTPEPSAHRPYFAASGLLI
ncbi:MAG: hypothetical protein ACYS76_07525 [Planctomycetota bacterium]